MAVIIPNAAEILWLKAAINHTAGEDLSLKLYTNNVAPDATYLTSSFTEASGGGYSPKPISGTSWSVATNTSGEAEANYSAQVFSFTGPLTANATIYGWYLIQQVSGQLIAAERLPSTTFTPATNGDSITIPPRLQLFSEN